MAVTRFWWLRHAPVDGPKGVIHGPDAPILAPPPPAIAALRQRLPTLALWLTSPTRRARDTVPLLTHSRPLVDPLLAEQDFGAWTGRTHADLAAEDPDGYRRFWQAAGTNRPPDGESFADQIARVGRLLDRLTAEHGGMDIVLVAHSGTVRAALSVALDLPPDRALSFAIDPLSLTRIDHIPGGGWRIGPVGA